MHICTYPKFVYITLSCLAHIDTVHRFGLESLTIVLSDWVFLVRYRYLNFLSLAELLNLWSLWSHIEGNSDLIFTPILLLLPVLSTVCLSVLCFPFLLLIPRRVSSLTIQLLPDGKLSATEVETLSFTSHNGYGFTPSPSSIASYEGYEIKENQTVLLADSFVITGP